MPDSLLRFEEVIYPVWRRALPRALRAALLPLLRRHYPVDVDQNPPTDTSMMARYLLDWRLSGERDLATIQRDLDRLVVSIETVPTDQEPVRYSGPCLRVPAQWEPGERVLVSWGQPYPMLYPMQAELVEALSSVATVDLLVSSETWARGIGYYLAQRGRTNFDRLRLLVLRTDDIWVRDYGPIVGIAPDGERVAVNPIYDVLPAYPQANDDSMTDHYAAYHGMRVQPLALRTEGGNLWSDGAGTLIMSEQIFRMNRYHTRESVTQALHDVFDFEKLIIPPRISVEETGHIDLSVKLGNANTVFISQPTSLTTAEVLRKTRRLFERETNAAGDSYNIIALPTPPLYLNWFVYPIRRAYTNALTINGHLLVPIYNTPEDDEALSLYAAHLPEFNVVPIRSTVGINGGGAVHCMTKEIP